MKCKRVAIRLNKNQKETVNKKNHTHVNIIYNTSYEFFLCMAYLMEYMKLDFIIPENSRTLNLHVNVSGGHMVTYIEYM